MCKILVIKNSPRKNSNSELLVNNCLKTIKKEKLDDVNIKIIYPHKLDIGPCMSCFDCYNNGQCRFKDDMQPLYDIFNMSDIILVSTPIFFNGLPSHLKAMIDRCQAIWSSKYISNSSRINRDKNRRGYLFATGGAPAYDEQFTAAKLVMSMFFKVINAEFKEQLLVSNIDKKPVKDRQQILADAQLIGQKIVDEICQQKD